MNPSGTPSSRRRLLAGAGGAAALVAGAALLAFGILDQDPPPPSAASMTTTESASPSAPAVASIAPPSPSSTATATTAPPAPELPSALGESDPVRITIPSIGVDSTFVELGLTDNAELDTPTNGADVGWFTGGHSPGARGVAVVAGHVTYNGPAVFFRLGELAAGTEVEIERADGSTAVFAVSRSATFPKSEFPSAEVYRPSDSAELVLITCGGAYADASYDSNVIVWAELVDSQP